MTRFARAKGSKASNERVPEEATSWGEMKQQLLEKNKQAEDTQKRQEADKQRQQNYKTFLQSVEEEESKNSRWADFSTEKSNNQKNDVEVSQKPKKRKLNDTSEVISSKNPNNQKNEVEASNKPKKPVKKGVKRKSNDTTEAKTKKIKDPATLSEAELKKIEKKKQKRLKQLEKKKQLKTEQQPKPQTTPKKKLKDKKVPERRKKPQDRMIINGKEVEIAYVDGFPIKKEDATRIHQLRKQMISKGLPRSEIKIALKLERRKAEKAFAREKKKVCFNCRKSGHNLSECPELGAQQLAESAGTGICFKCGSTEHTHFECKVVRGQEFKFAQCFICHEQGHIARQCPDNARGLYPKGGACKVCGDVTHLKKDCPKYQAQQQQEQQHIHLETLGEDNPDNLNKTEDVRIGEPKRRNKIIKF